MVGFLRNGWSSSPEYAAVNTEDPHYATAKEFAYEHNDPNVLELKVLTSFKYAGSGGNYVEYEDRIDLTGKPCGTYKIRLETRKDVGGNEPTENLKFEVYVSKILVPVQSTVQTKPMAVEPGATSFSLNAEGIALEKVTWAVSLDGGQTWTEAVVGTDMALPSGTQDLIVKATLSIEGVTELPAVVSFDLGFNN
ncbi:MAG: hypothetical protein EHM35_10120, partial [Planctomycetaceae bacterium]